MRGKLLLFLGCGAFLWACNSSKSTTGNEKSEVVYTVGEEKMYLDEFSYVFNKNRNIVKDTIDGQYVDDYLERSINYKLKLNEAYALQMDTNPEYVNELAGYRKTLAKSYLSDKSVSENLKKEAYDRMQWEVKASHILVSVAPNAKPEDSLAAYQKISEIRSKIVKDGKSFAELAMSSSEDPSAKKNKGDLGYFTALQMIYPFENQAYNTEVGDVSEVFRTRFGYHILKVYDKRKSIGNVEVAHIYKASTPQNDLEVQNTMQAIYSALTSGSDFDALVLKHSEDNASKGRGGKLGYVNSYSNLPSIFKDRCFAINEDGGYSQPFKTQNGWHIVKRLSVKPLESYKEMDYTLTNKINRDSRSNLSREAVIRRIKKDNDFKVNTKAKDRVFEAIDESYLTGTWKNEIENPDEVLLTYTLETFTVGDFADFMLKLQKPTNDASLESLLNAGFDTYVDFTTLDYEERNLDKTNTDFQNIYREYRDAILVFNISGEEVWNKASEDTTGLKEYFAANRTNYTWGERVDAVLFNASTKEIMDKAIAMSKEGIAYDSILRVINRENVLNLVIKEGKYQKGEDELIDKVYMRQGYKELTNHYMDLGAIEADQFIVILVNKWLPPMQKELNETRGPVISDYQKELEKSWLSELRIKYPVVIDQKVFDKFKSNALK